MTTGLKVKGWLELYYWWNILKYYTVVRWDQTPPLKDLVRLVLGGDLSNNDVRMHLMSAAYGEGFDDDVRKHIHPEAIINAIHRFSGTKETEIKRCATLISRICVSRARTIELDPQIELFVPNEEWAGQCRRKYTPREINLVLERTGKKHVHHEASLLSSPDPAHWRPQLVVANCKNGMYRDRFSQDKLLCRLPVFPDKSPFICPSLNSETPRISNHNTASKQSIANGWKGYSVLR